MLSFLPMLWSNFSFQHLVAFKLQVGFSIFPDFQLPEKREKFKIFRKFLIFDGIPEKINQTYNFATFFKLLNILKDRFHVAFA